MSHVLEGFRAIFCESFFILINLMFSLSECPASFGSHDWKFKEAEASVDGGGGEVSKRQKRAAEW